MVAHLLRLRLDLLTGSLRGRGDAVARAVIGLVLLVVATVGLCLAVLTLTDAPADRTQAILVLAGGAVTIGCAAAPIVLGISDPLDPRRFAVFGLSPRALAPGVALAGLISVPVIALASVLVCIAIVWQAHDVPAAFAILGAVLAFVTSVLIARCSLAVSTLVFRDRRSRELSGLFLLVLVVVVVPVAVFLASLEWRGGVPSALAVFVQGLSVSPFGAAWALPLAGSLDGSAGGVATWIPLVVSLVTVGLLWLAWSWLVDRLVSHVAPSPALRQRGGLGWFAVLPGIPLGAIAARSLIYWLRDGRYLANVVVIPFAAVLATVPLLVAGVPAPLVALLPVPVIALFLGWLPHNDVAYDSTAIWMHMASGVRGVSDRIGRLAPIVLIGVPVLAVAIPVCTALYGRWAILPAMIGVAASLFLCGLGFSSIASVLAPYAVAQPGHSPFQQPQRNGSSGVLSQSLVMLCSLVLSAPVLWWGWQAVTTDVDYASSALVGGLVTGGVVLVVGVILGGIAFDRRGDRIMEFAETA